LPPFASEQWLNCRRLDYHFSTWCKTLGSTSADEFTLIAPISGEVVSAVRIARSGTSEIELGLESADLDELTSKLMAPGFTGKGIGTLLTQCSIDHFREQYFTRAVLRVIATNAGARRFTSFMAGYWLRNFPTVSRMCL